MPGLVVGRESELAAAERFLDAVSLGPSCLVFEGEPGIGKTTAWREVARRAEGRGYRVLSCRPAEAETKLSYTGLADLLRDMEGAVLDHLPAPQRHALEVALLRTEDDGLAPERRTVFSAFASAVSVMAEARPLVVAVDDLQWLDAPSCAALEFVMRRLDARPAGLVASLRIGDEAPVASSLARALGDLQTERVRLGPLSIGALHALITHRLAQEFARPTLIRIAAASAGNPFYALEIAGELTRRGGLDPGEALPVPADLSALVWARIGRLPARTREAVLAAAALSQPTLDLVDARALGAAREAGIVEMAEGRISFVHPLYASVVYASAGAEERRRLHLRLSRRIADPEERARHLALAAERPDEEIAMALEAAAARARRRGAPEAAAELLELAVGLTAPNPANRRYVRSIAAAEHHFHAGDLARARALVEAVLAGDAAGAERGQALRILGEIRYHEDSFAEAIPLFDSALAYLRDDPSAVGVRLNLAFARTSLGDHPGAAAQVGAALEQSIRFGDQGLQAVALAGTAIVDLLLGRKADWDRIEQALALEDPDRQIMLQMRPSLIAALVLIYSDQLEHARDLLVGLWQRTIEHGEESGLPFLAYNLALLERLRGDLHAAARVAGEGYEIASQLGSKTMQILNLAERCMARTIAGDVPGARVDADEARRLAGEVDYLFGDLWTHVALGFLETSLGNPAAAAEALEPLAAGAELRGYCDPLTAFFLPDEIEALIALGELDRAGSLAAMLEQHAHSQHRVLALATGGRSYSLLFAAGGDPERAAAAMAQALGAHAQLEMPFELGRTLLVNGLLERKAKRKRAARDSFERALSIFDQLGATLWAERARSELDRSYRRRSAPGELTPVEQRIAELAAAGLTNRAIAEQVFLSPKTVEADLARIYRKLGVHSRAGLGYKMAGRDGTATNRETPDFSNGVRP
jgi:DNA-binding CsgD family transcriptional regulator